MGWPLRARAPSTRRRYCSPAVRNWLISLPPASAAVKVAPPERKKGCTVMVTKPAENTSTAIQVMGRFQSFLVS